MTEEQFRDRKLLVDAVAPVLTLLGIVIGVWQFTAQTRQTREREHAADVAQAATEFRRQVWQERLGAYRQLVASAGAAAASAEDQGRFRRSAQAFDSLYWGASVFVTDSLVDDRLKAFHVALRDHQAGRSTPGMSSGDVLRTRADSLAVAARDGLAREWAALSRP